MRLGGRRDAMRKFGYSLVGKPAYSQTSARKRFSAIGILSTEGILDVYITSSKRKLSWNILLGAYYIIYCHSMRLTLAVW